VSRWPVAAFVALVIATIAAFFITQHFKVATPFLAGLPSPHPATINPVSGGVCELKNSKGVAEPTNFKQMKISFYLVHRDDNVDVSIVNTVGQLVDTLATDRRMGIYKRQAFVWNGRTTSGAYAQAGTYYVRVSLIHQGRTVEISKESGGPKPITVETKAAPIRVKSVRVDGRLPAILPTASGTAAVINFTRTGRTPPTIEIYRTDVPGTPQLVNHYRAKTFKNAFWNGTLKDGKPAPQGTYLVALRSRDRACALQRFPSSIPPASGSTPRAGVTIRYLAAQAPTTPVAPGGTAQVEVDARQHGYSWALRRAGSKAILSSGRASSTSLSVKVPAGGPGLYDLALRYGIRRTVVPIVGGGTSTSAERKGVLVVLPALTWQGENPVDDDDDGLPNTLTAGDTISLARPYAHGLPAGISGEAGLIAYLRSTGKPFSLTTDLALPSDLDGYSGVVFAGSERWLPAQEGSALSTYVEQGGHIMSLGLDALRRSVTVSGQTASDPSAAHPTDDLLARPGQVHATHGSLLLADQDALGLFKGTGKTLTGFDHYQSFGPVQAPAKLQSAAGVSPSSPAVIGYSLGKGDVVDVGLPGFGSRLAHNVSAQALVNSAWTLLTSK
jgi:flagellar hook assembly protein FlgD